MNMKKYNDTLPKYLERFTAGQHSGWVSEFEEQFLRTFPGKFAISVNSATSGLHAALYALGVSDGDEVIQPGLTVVMDSFMTKALGAKPVYADVDPDTFNISPQSIEDVITSKTKCIIIVDWQGLPCDYDAIQNISQKYNIPVICDSAQTVLGTYKNERCGDQFDFHIYSFEQKKHLTTGSEGGMVVCNDPKLATKCRQFAGIGYKHLTADAGRTSLSKSEAQDPDYKRFAIRGLNYRMNEITACIGLSQLENIEQKVEARLINASYFIEVLKQYDFFQLQTAPYAARHTYYTVGARYTGKLPWKTIYNRYRELGAKPFYASVSVPYLEQPNLEEDELQANSHQVNCANAETIQRQIMAFKTNYDNHSLAQKDASLLKRTLDELLYENN